MSDSMKYNHAGIDGHAVAIKGHSNNMNTMLDDLAAQLRAFEQRWEGDGSVAYIALKRQWDQAAAGLNATLLKVGQVVSAGNDAMRATDRSVAGSFGG